MTVAVIITGSILGVIGIGFSIWSIIDTRKRTSTSKHREKIKKFTYLDEYNLMGYR